MDTIAIFKDFLLPLFVCVVLPVMIVFLVQFYRSRNLARKAEIIKAAIEKGVQIDAMQGCSDRGRAVKCGPGPGQEGNVCKL